MSYTEFDSSISSGQTARLYQIDRSATKVWRYTSADRPIFFNGHEFAPLAIGDDGVRITGEASAETLVISLPASAPVAQLYRGTPPAEEIFVTVFDYDAGAQDGEVCWIGSISGVIWPELGKAELSCDSLSASMRRDGLRLRYERACPHSVYDSECGVDKALHALPVVITGLDGASVQFDPAAIPDARVYVYGALEWTADGATELRGIEATTAGQVTLIGGTFGLAVGQQVTLYPGCDGVRGTCDFRFGNLLNHGGFPHMPGKSIFSGERLW
ncbi:hypothetical protein GY14_27060 [Delftia tsuruhatensis]|nr:hypothetical protein GY14_27060 [Delftia tsuruhatensis]